LDLTPYLARGFSPEIDAHIANTPVRGLDQMMSQSKIRLAPETEAYLYGEYTPVEVRYRPGSRPRLEAVAAEVLGSPPRTDRAAIRELVSWVPRNVRHAAGVDPSPPDRAISAEEIIESGWGWCNEQARVAVALARTAGVAGRLVAVYSLVDNRAHMTAELHVEGKWSWACLTHDCVVPLRDGSWAGAAEILFDPEARARFAAEWKRCVDIWNADHGKPPLEGDPAAQFGAAGIVNCPTAW
jgi:hypothetical protein